MRTAASQMAVILWVLGFGMASGVEAALLSYEQVVLQSQPVVYYRFNEQPGAGQATDSSGNGHHGTYNGDATTVISELGLGRALRLDGAGDYVRMPSSFSMNALSLEAWIYPDQLYDWDAIFNNEGWSSGNVHYQFRYDNKKLEFAIRDNNPGTHQFEYAFAEDQWYHVVLTYSATDKKNQLFVNGVLRETGSYTTANTASFGPCWIGGWNGGAGSRFFNGMIDEFAIYNRVLSPEEILAHYQAVVPEPVSLQLAGAGLLALGILCCRRRRWKESPVGKDS